MKFKQMTAHELANLLLAGPNVPVLIEDQEICLVAHDRINVATIAHDTKGPCVSLSVLATANRNFKNFKYANDGNLYVYRSLPCRNNLGLDRTFSICGTDTQGGSGVLEWCNDLGDAKYMYRRMVNYPQFVDLKIYNEGQLCTFPIGEL